MLLRAPGSTVAEVAEQLGYSDVANFSRAFRRWSGTSPAAYRDGDRARLSAQPRRSRLGAQLVEADLGRRLDHAEALARGIEHPRPSS